MKCSANQMTQLWVRVPILSLGFPDPLRPNSPQASAPWLFEELPLAKPASSWQGSQPVNLLPLVIRTQLIQHPGLHSGHNPA